MSEHAQGQGIAKLYSVCRTRLGDAMFPGKDVFTAQLRNHFNEMLVEHLDAGRQRSAIAFGQSLSEFTPASVRDAEGEWKIRHLDRWEKEQRPLIFQALEDFFINGGHEARVKTQREFVTALIEAGIQIEGEVELLDELAFSGDWHAAFAKMTLQGRSIGIRITAKSGCDRQRMAIAASGAGFATEDFARIAASI